MAFITSVNHITLAVKDIDKSFAFYRNVLQFQPIVKWDKGAYFLAGNFWFCLNVDNTRVANSCYTHYAFTVSKKQFDEIAQSIILSGAKIFKENTSPGESLYFLDPDDHKLEIHTGNWEARVSSKKNDPGQWKNVQWFL